MNAVCFEYDYVYMVIADGLCVKLKGNSSQGFRFSLYLFFVLLVFFKCLLFISSTDVASVSCVGIRIHCFIKTIVMRCLNFSLLRELCPSILGKLICFFRFQKISGLPCSFPANVTHSALYLSHLLDKKRVSAVTMAHAALNGLSILPLVSIIWILDFASI